MKSQMNIGSSSLILIFIILCLTTFALLSLSSAKGDWSLAQKNAQAVKDYYTADNQGQEFLQMADQALKSDPQTLESQLGDYYDPSTGLISTDITMDRGQALHIELKPDQKKSSVIVQTWKVYNSEDYEIDDSMPVWSGQ